MRSKDKLESILTRINGRGYKAYRELHGDYDLGTFRLHIDKVQSDPFAPPSRIRISFSQELARFPENFVQNNWQHPSQISLKIALEDFLIRQFGKQCLKFKGKISGTGNSGLIAIDPCGQEILNRSAMEVNIQIIQARIMIGLPARGRTVLGGQAKTIFLDILPQLVENSLVYARLPQKELQRHLQCYADQVFLRNQLKTKGLVAFIANGAILPRASGISDKPLPATKATIFHSPPELEIQMDLPHNRKIKGMGIPKGVTLIVGGGYHGKSTLLSALQAGVYNHIPGDGRELAVTEKSGVKIRAEDGRSVQGVDISPFISNLPQGRSTKKFCTENASGSTSQAANIIEALEAGAKVLLLDEDTSATNFMIRDGRMQQLVSKENEPITPFVDRVRELYEQLEVSTILVLGGSGDYFDVADNVLMLKAFQPLVVTKEAKQIAAEMPAQRRQETATPLQHPIHRQVKGSSFALGPRSKVKVKDRQTILFDRQSIDLSFVEQLVSPSQTRAIAQILMHLAKSANNSCLPLPGTIDSILRQVQKEGLDCLSPNVKKPFGDLALPRKQEILAAINRFRGLQTV